MSNSENQVLLADGAKSDDELSLFDLMTFARRHSLASLGGALIGGALGVAVASALPAQWEAVTLLQVAQLGAEAPVEPPPRVVERIAQKSFLEDARKHMGALPGSNPKESLLCTGIKAKIEKTDLISVRVRSRSSDEAARCADALVKELAIIHAKMAEPTLQRWRSEVEDIDMELRRGTNEFSWVRGLLEKPSVAPAVTSLYQISLASNILVFRGTQLRELRERKRVLQEQLSPERSFPTTLFGRADVSKGPVFPKKSLFAVGGLVMGSLMGVCLSVLRHAGARSSAQIKTD